MPFPAGQHARRKASQRDYGKTGQRVRARGALYCSSCFLANLARMPVVPFAGSVLLLVLLRRHVSHRGVRSAVAHESIEVNTNGRNLLIRERGEPAFGGF